MADRTQEARERAEITIVVCPECGQDDRVRNLKVGARHYAWGKRCEGLPEAITYVRADRVAALETALHAKDEENKRLRQALDHVDGDVVFDRAELGAAVLGTA